MKRRTFLRTAAVAAMAPLPLSYGQSSSPNDRITVAVMGVNGRGGKLLDLFADHGHVDIAYVCDVDSDVLGKRVERLQGRSQHRPQLIGDFRKALDDKRVDALVVGTPDHWHALATIHACQAGKDVYVEKPDAHNILESRTMIAAARKYSRVVQLGTQGRSRQLQQEAMQYLAAGKLGTVRFAKAWESSRQGNIRHPADTAAPPHVDYDRWLGPAPLRPFNPRRFHGSWRWFLDYGTGDLGNDGVHLLDFARWGLESALQAEGRTLPQAPKAVSAHGGKLYFDDDQEWPDTAMFTYDYGDYLLTYELRIWTAYYLEGEAEGSAVYGDQGYITLGHDRWRAFDPKGKLLFEKQGESGDAEHVDNFVQCMHTRQRPAADLETVGHRSSLLCHLGNAAWRAGRTLRYDPTRGEFTGDPDANQFLTRTYRAPWELPKLSAVESLGGTGGTGGTGLASAASPARAQRPQHGD